MAGGRVARGTGEWKDRKRERERRKALVFIGCKHSDIYISIGMILYIWRQ